MKRKVLFAMAAAAALGLCACSPAVATSSETSSSPESTSSSSSSSSTPTVTINKISEITKAGDYTVKGVVEATYTKGMIISDTSGSALVYLGAAPADYSIGDYLKVQESLTDDSVYRGVYQFSSNAKISELNKTDAPTITTTATALTKEVADGWNASSFDISAVQKYSWDAKAVGSKYTTLNFADSATVIEPLYVDSSVFTLETGKSYHVEGYFIGYDTTNSFASIMLTKAEEYATGVTLTSADNADTIPLNGTITLTATSASGAAITFSSSDETVATVSASGVVTGTSKAGKTTITATAATGDTATLDIYVADETVKNATISDLVDGTISDVTSLYSVTGILENSDGGVYGNASLTDFDSGKSITIYGNTTTASAIYWTKGAPKFKNPKDAQTTLSTVKDGQSVTVTAVFSKFNNVPELMAVTTQHVASTNTYTASLDATENGTASLDKTSGLTYGATVTVACAPSDGYKVSAVTVTTAFGNIQATVSATDNNTYTFTVTCVNKVVVKFISDVPVTSFVINTTTISAPTAYGDSLSDISVNDSQVGIQLKACMSGTNLGVSYIQTNKRPSWIYNTTAVPGYITGITIAWDAKTTSTNKNMALLCSTESLPSVLVGTEEGVSLFGKESTTFPFDSASHYTYFQLCHVASVSDAMYIDSITISFSAAE